MSNVDVKVTHVGELNPKLFEQTMLHLIEWLEENGGLPFEEDVAEIVAEYAEDEPEIEVVS